MTTLRFLHRGMFAATAVLTASLSVAATVGPASAATRCTATQVTLVQTGGFAGVHHRYVVEATTAHAETPALMQMTSSQRFLRLHPAYPASTPGADRFSYTVTVRYTNGTSKTVDTVDGAAAPAILWQTIDMTRQIGLDSTPATAH